MNAVSKICKGIDKFYKLFYYLAGFTLMVLLVISTFVICARSLFSYSPIWSDEIQRFLLIATVFFCLPYLTSSKSHLLVNLTEIFFGKRKKFNRVMMIIGEFLLLGLLIFLIFPSCTLVAKNTRIFSAAMRIPMSYMFMLMPVSFALSAFATVKNIVHDLFVKEPEEEVQ